MPSPPTTKWEKMRPIVLGRLVQDHKGSQDQKQGHILWLFVRLVTYTTYEFLFPILFYPWPSLTSFMKWYFSLKSILAHLARNPHSSSTPATNVLWDKLPWCWPLAVALLSGLSLSGSSQTKGNDCIADGRTLEHRLHQQGQLTHCEFYNLGSPCISASSFFKHLEATSDVTCSLGNKPETRLNIGLSHGHSARSQTVPSPFTTVK